MDPPLNLVEIFISLIQVCTIHTPPPFLPRLTSLRRIFFWLSILLGFPCFWLVLPGDSDPLWDFVGVFLLHRTVQARQYLKHRTSSYINYENMFTDLFKQGNEHHLT